MIDDNNVNKVLLDQYLDCIRMGSKYLTDINEDKYRDRLFLMMNADVEAGRSTGHERKALRLYKEYLYQRGVDI